MPHAADRAAFDAFVADAATRVARLAREGLSESVPGPYRAAAKSVARQATGAWTLALREGSGFRMSGAMREIELGQAFGRQCQFVLEMLNASRNPDLVAALGKLEAAGNVRSGVMSAFFHYFVAHEFVHVEQGLGSDQYEDSDYYMPVVMEADYVADVAGLVIVLHAGVPEMACLSRYEAMIVLIAIHIASMHSFQTDADEGLDFFAFTRLVLWYLHFARLNRAGVEPALDAPSFMRSWVVTFPRLIGREDQLVTPALLDRRAAAPLAAASDVVLAFHADDGLYRIHRAALTDAGRTGRLCRAVLDRGFDNVRVEMEELLVNNPALVPSPATAGVAGVVWAAGEVMDLLERLPSVPDDQGGRADLTARTRYAFARFVGAVRAVRPATPDIEELILRGEEIVVELEAAARAGTLPAVRRRALSVVDQLVLASSPR